MEISEIQSMIDTAKFEEVILATDKLTENNSEGKLYKSLAYSFLGDLELANKQANEVLKEALDNRSLNLEFAALTSITQVKILQGDIDINGNFDKTYSVFKELRSQTDYKLTYWSGYIHFIEGLYMFTSGNIEPAGEYIVRANEIAKELDWKFLIYFLKFFTSAKNILSGSLDESISLINPLLEKMSTENYKLLEGYANSITGAIYLIKGDFEKFKECAFVFGDLSRKIKYKLGLAEFQGSLGLYYLNTSNLEKALICFQEEIEILNQMGSRLNFGSIYRFLGEIHYKKGELKEALESYKKSLKIRIEYNDTYGIGESFSHIGKIYQEFGDLDFALENYQKGLNIRKNVNFISAVAASYDLIGNLYFEMNELKMAGEYYDKALEIKRQLGNDFSIATSLFNKIRINIGDQHSSVSMYFEELQSINAELENKQVDLYTKLAEALILKNSKRGLKKSQAQLILLEISKMEIIDHGLTVFALLNLVEILLWELKSSGEKEILVEIEETISKLVEIATTKNLPALLVKTLLFQSKFALLNLNIDEAKQFLNRAEEIATDNGLRHLAIIISNEFDKLLSQVDTWEELIERKLDYKQVVDLTQFEQILKRIDLQKNENLVPETPILLLILSEAGSTIFSNKFTDIEIQESLMGSFLSAINTFGKETFSHEGSIERIIHQNYTILIKSVHSLLFCFIIKGNSYSATQKLDTFIESVEASTIWNSLIETPYKLDREIISSLEQISKDLFNYSETVPEEKELEKNSNVRSENSDDYLVVPKELLSYKFLLNPIRLYIIKTLYNYFRYPAAELRKLLGIPWGTFNDHIEALSKNGFIESQKEFVQQSPRNILYLTASGEVEYSNLKSILHSFMH